MKEFEKLLEKSIRELRERIEFEKEFIDGIIQEAAVTYFDIYQTEGYMYNEDYYIDRLDFYAKCHEKLYWIGDYMCNDIIEIYYHYLETTEPYLKDNNIGIDACKKEMTPEDIDGYRKNIPNLKEEDLLELIEEENIRLKWEFEAEEKFHGVIKKFLTPYLEDCDHFPARAYREVNYLSWICYLDFMFEMHDLAYAIRKPVKTNSDENSEPVN